MVEFRNLHNGWKFNIDAEKMIIPARANMLLKNRPFDPSPLHFSLLRQLVDTPRHYAVTGKLRVTMYFERVMNALNSTPATLTVKSSAYKS